MADYLEISDELRAKITEHYSRKEIIDALLEAAPNKEVVGSFGGVGYGKRPDFIEYDNDITLQVKKGVTSFHVSEESWSNSMGLVAGMDKKKQEALRSGWDLIIDIDSPHWEICKLITHLLVQEIKANGVNNVSVKFSGNKGFHIGVPQESFPKGFEKDFPNMPRKIAAYLLEKIHDRATEAVTEMLKKEYGEDAYYNQVEAIFHKPRAQMIKFNKKSGADELDPLEIIEVDTLLISSRHLYRMTYSVNEKSGMVSIPINPDKILLFQKAIAKIENKVFSRYKFLDRTSSVFGEAHKLFIESIDANIDPEKFFKTEIELKLKEEKTKSAAQIEFEAIKEKIPEANFPDAIKKMLEGKISDGKKRALFVLKNFLNCVGWTYAEIEERLEKWNSTHPEPIRDTILKGQLMYLKQAIAKNEKILPPNYDSNNYYADIIGDMPEYRKAKNPVTLAQRIFNTVKKQDTAENKKKAKLEKQNKSSVPSSDEGTSVPVKVKRKAKVKSAPVDEV